MFFVTLYKNFEMTEEKDNVYTYRQIKQTSSFASTHVIIFTFFIISQFLSYVCYQSTMASFHRLLDFLLNRYLIFIVGCKRVMLILTNTSTGCITKLFQKKSLDTFSVYLLIIIAAQWKTAGVRIDTLFNFRERHDSICCKLPVNFNNDRNFKAHVYLLLRPKIYIYKYAW